jgi:hypothetical protein
MNMFPRIACFIALGMRSVQNNGGRVWLNSSFSTVYHDSKIIFEKLVEYYVPLCQDQIKIFF